MVNGDYIPRILCPKIREYFGLGVFMKKFLFLIIVAGGLGIGAKFYLATTPQGKFADFLRRIPLIKDAGTETFEIKTRQLITTAPGGKRIYKSFTDQVTYSYTPGDSKQQRLKRKQAAGKAAMAQLIKEAKQDTEQLRQGLKYYKDIDRQLLRLEGGLPSKSDNRRFVRIERIRAVLKERANSYELLPEAVEEDIEEALKELASSLSGVQKRRGVVAPGNVFINWYNDRFVKYPAYRKCYRKK